MYMTVALLSWEFDRKAVKGNWNVGFWGRLNLRVIRAIELPGLRTRLLESCNLGDKACAVPFKLRSFILERLYLR